RLSSAPGPGQEEGRGRPRGLGRRRLLGSERLTQTGERGNLDMERQLYFYEYVNRRASDIVAIVENRALEVFQSATNTALDKTEQFRAPPNVDFAVFGV